MTDKEIIKAFNGCINRTIKCVDCPYNRYYECMKIMYGDVVKIVISQQAEIERIAAFSQSRFETGYKEKEQAEHIREKTIKEFAEKLKAVYDDFDEEHEVIMFDNLSGVIDDILDEMLKEK